MTGKREETDISDISAPSDPPGLPERYRNVREIARGGMAVVFAAFDAELEREVAIKVLDAPLETGTAARERFFREAKILAALQHQNIVRLMGFGETSQRSPYFVMELLRGETLAERLSKGPLTVSEFKSIALHVLNGLEYASSAGFIHRDIKPSNIFLCDQRPLVAKICDFGIARPQMDAKLTATAALIGSPLYMSPEQCTGQNIDHRSDIYAVGCVFYECLSGVPPFKGETPLATMTLHAREPVPKLRIVGSAADDGQELVNIVRQCLRKDPAERPQSFTQLKSSLQRVLSELSESSLAVATPQKESAHRPAPLVVAITSITIPVLLSAIMLKSLWRQERSEQPPVAPTNAHTPDSYRQSRELEIKRLEHKLSRDMSAKDKADGYFALTDTYRSMGEAYYHGQPALAAGYFTRAKQLAPRSSNPARSLCRVICTEARCKIQGNEPDEKLIAEAIRQSDHLKDPEQRIISRCAQALLYVKKTETSKALAVTKEAYDILDLASKGIVTRAVAAEEATKVVNDFSETQTADWSRQDRLRFVEMLWYLSRIYYAMTEPTSGNDALRKAKSVLSSLPSEKTDYEVKLRAKIAAMSEQENARTGGFGLWD